MAKNKTKRTGRNGGKQKKERIDAGHLTTALKKVCRSGAPARVKRMAKETLAENGWLSKHAQLRVN